MTGLRRRTRETTRHERATVLQQLGAAADDPLAWQAQRELEVSRMERALKRGGGRHDQQGLGPVADKSAGGTRPIPAEPSCDRCNDAGCWYCGRG